MESGPNVPSPLEGGRWPSLPISPPKVRDLERGGFPSTSGPRRKAKAWLGTSGPHSPASSRKASPGERAAWGSLWPTSLDVSYAQQGGGGHGRGCVFKALMKNVSPQLSSKDAHSLCHVLHLQTLQGGPKQAHSVSVQNRPYSCTIISCPRVISHTNHWEPAFAPQRPQYFPGAPRPASG